jgi:hypothetical protein
LLLLLLVVSSCARGDGDGDKTTGTSGASSTTDRKPTGPVPYFLFDADGWTLTAGMSSGPVIDAGAAFGLKWNASYVSNPTPDHSVGAALAVSDPDGGAKVYAKLLTGRAGRAVTVGGHRAYAAEEHRGDGALVASHVLWDTDGYVVTLTVYETKVADAIPLAEHVSRVSKEQWDAATTGAN